MRKSTNTPALIPATKDPMSPTDLTAAVRAMQGRVARVERLVGTLTSTVDQLVDDAVERLTADFTPEQLDEVRQACRDAFETAASRIRAEAGR